MAGSFSAKKGGDEPIVAVNGELADTSGRVLNVLVVVPHVEASYLLLFAAKVEANQISRSLLRVLRLEEGREPHMPVVRSAVHPVFQLVQRAHIIINSLQIVKIPRIGLEHPLFEGDRGQVAVQELKGSESNVELVSPGRVDHYGDTAADATPGTLPVHGCPRHGAAIHARAWSDLPPVRCRLQVRRGRPGDAEGASAEQRLWEGYVYLVFVAVLVVRVRRQVRRQPVVLCDPLQHILVLGEQDVLAGLLWRRQDAGSSPDLSRENTPPIKEDLEVPYTSARVKSGLVIVPHADHANLCVLFQVDCDRVSSAWGEGSQPHMKVISCEIHLVKEFVRSPRVVLVLVQHIDRVRVSCDLTHNILHRHRKPSTIKDFDPG
mmetsp:Transcript_1801/g.3441  ORF Transcript_1801/g.3441 Transcript_1801/m.3441 type:complete len:377 (-) Transcript_1801:864-1994(-)